MDDASLQTEEFYRHTGWIRASVRHIIGADGGPENFPVDVSVLRDAFCAEAVRSPISRRVSMRRSAIFRRVFSKAGLYKPITLPSPPTMGI